MRDDVQALFAQSLQGDEDDDDAWDAIQQLWKLGTPEVFEQAAEWCGASEPKRRRRGADVLAQLGKTADNPYAKFGDESFAVLLSLLRHEEVPHVIKSAILALGHSENVRVVPVIASLRGHSNAGVRFSVAVALGNFANEALSVQTFIHLMTDSDSVVRDWATFGLGVQGDTDTVEIREALLRGTKDADEDAREEAIAGLAKRKDFRVLPALRSSLETGIGTRNVEAACLLLDLDEQLEDWGSTRYLEALQERYPK